MRSALALVAALLLVVPAAVAQDPPGTALFKTIKAKVGADKPFSLLVTAKVKDGSADKFRAAAAKVAAATRKEKGNGQYDFFRSVDEPNTFYLVEKWHDLPALEAHFQAPHLLAFLKALGDVADGPPKIRVVTPVAPAK